MKFLFLVWHDIIDTTVKLWGFKSIDKSLRLQKMFENKDSKYL